MFRSVDVCVHGAWNDSTNVSCSCDAGWVTSNYQDAFAPVFVWCNYSDPRPPPRPKSTLTAILDDMSPAVLLLMIMALPVGVIIIITLYCCCCRRGRGNKTQLRSSSPQQPQPQQEGVTAPFNQQALGSVVAVPMHVVPMPMHANSAMYLPSELTYHNMFVSPAPSGYPPQFFYNEPYTVEPVHSHGDGNNSTDQQRCEPTTTTAAAAANGSTT